MTDTADLVSRARGLSGHLLVAGQFTALCDNTLSQVIATLRSLGAISDVPAGVSTLPELEWALRRKAAQRLDLLAKWAGPRVRVLAPLFEDEDHRTLRALVRAIVSGIPSDQRLSGLIPTRSLPERALRLLAACNDISRFAALLVAWRNPFGAALAEESMRARPDLFRIELALARVTARHPRRIPQGDRALRLFCSRMIDFRNLSNAFVLVAHPVDSATADLFLPGGRLVHLSDIEFARSAGNAALLSIHLRRRLRGTSLADTIDPGATRDAEDALLDALVTEFRQLARREPTTLAPVIAFVLRQRAELRTLRRIAWSIALGVPPGMIRQNLGVAA